LTDMFGGRDDTTKLQDQILNEYDLGVSTQSRSQLIATVQNLT